MRVRDILRSEKGVSRIDLLGLLSTVLSLSTEKLITQTEKELRRCEEERFSCLLEERRQGRPMAYITGEKEFFSRSFTVDRRVLIPRPETEMLVEECLRIFSALPEKAWRMIDVGTGSGAIAISVARETGKNVTCVDISRNALEVAKVNASIHQVSDLLDFVCSDLFSAFGREGTFDLITANLPYVSEDEWSTLIPDVRFFEPKLALWAGKDGMDSYLRLIPEVGKHLAHGGHVLCEIGSREQAEVLSELLRGVGLAVRTEKDLAGRDRMVVGSCKSSS